MANLRDIDQYVTWDEKRKQFLPVYWRKEVLPKWLMFDLSDVQGPYTIAAAPANTPPVGWKQPYASVEGLDGGLGTPFEVRSLVFASHSTGAPPFAETTATANFTVRLKDQGTVREFMNRDIHIRCLAGTAQTPALLREPYMFLSQQNISAFFTKVAGGAVAVRMALVGAEYFPWSPEFLRRPVARETIRRVIGRWIERRKYVLPYWLTTDVPVNLGVGAQADFLMKIGDDGHFQAFTMSAVSTGAFGWELSEAKTNQNISNGQVTLANGLGTANFPTLLPTEYTVPAGYRLRLRLTNLSAAPNSIFFTMTGRKVYVPFKDVKDVLKDTAVPTPADTPSLIVPPPFVHNATLIK